MTRILGIEIAGDNQSSAAIAEATAGAEKFGATVDAVADKNIERLAAQRAKLQELAAAYSEVAATAESGSEKQIVATKLAADAEAKLAAQTRVAGAEMSVGSLAAKEGSASMGVLGGAAKSAYGSMALFLGVPIIAGGVVKGISDATHATQDFSASMELLHTQARASQAEVKKMTTALERLAPTVGTGPDELAAGLYHIESAGLRGSKALAALTAAAKGARIGNANLEDVTNALNAVLVSGIKGSEDYNQAMGVLNATVGSGDMRMQDLADAMGTGLPAKAAIAGVSLRDISAALAVFGDNNIRGAKAGTQLASAIRLMEGPSHAAAKAMAEYDINAKQLGETLATSGLPAAITLLHDKLGDLDHAELTAALTPMFGGKQATGVSILVDQLDRLETKIDENTAGARTFGSDWSAYTQQSKFATQQFDAQIDSLRIQLGALLLPALTDVTRELNKLTAGALDWIHSTQGQRVFGDISTGAREFGRVMGVLGSTAGTVLHGLDKEVTGVSEVVRGVVSGVGAVIHGQWGAAWHDAESAARGALKTVEALPDVFAPELAGHMKSLAHRGVNALDNELHAGVGAAEAAGRELVLGIAHGMDSVVGSVVGEAKHIAGEVKNFLSFHWGSTPREWAAKNVGRELTGGISDGFAADVPRLKAMLEQETVILTTSVAQTAKDAIVAQFHNAAGAPLGDDYVQAGIAASLSANPSAAGGAAYNPITGEGSLFTYTGPAMPAQYGGAALAATVGGSSLGSGGSPIHRPGVPMLASGGDIRAAGLAYLHPGERVLPADVVRSTGGAGASVTIQVIAPQYVGDKRDLADAIKSPQVQEAVATAVILASRGGHIRQGDIRP